MIREVEFERPLWWIPAHLVPSKGHRCHLPDPSKGNRHPGTWGRTEPMPPRGGMFDGLRVHLHRSPSG
jgi:hypothetical protein